MPGHDLIVIGASAGGVQALSELLRHVPREIPAAILIVVHTSPTSPGVLPQVLDRAGGLPVTPAHDGAVIRNGHVYVAPPDHHLLVNDRRMLLSRGPRENGFRPAVDPMFRTAARQYGPRVVGVVLSGGLDDGSEGLLYIKRTGGIAIVQDPVEAYFPSMPQSAIQSVAVDHVLPICEMPPLLFKLAREPAAVPEGAFPMTDGDGEKVRDVAEIGDNWLKTGGMPGPPSDLTCPDCGGALWELREEKLLRFRCHIGHGYTEQGLVAAKNGKLEEAMWNALRVLEENAALHRRLMARAREANMNAIAEMHDRKAHDTNERAALIREVLMRDQKDASLDLQQPEPVASNPRQRGNGRSGHATTSNGGNGASQRGRKKSNHRGRAGSSSKPSAGADAERSSLARRGKRNPGKS